MTEAFDLQRLLLSLGVVLLLLVFLALAARQWRLRSPLQGGTELEVLSSTYVGPKERVILLRVRDREVLLGVSPQQISTLSELAEASHAEAQ
ncbi:MAG: flagellar biosynthetic protein FliO [Pseudomonadota bacterium]